jgi:Family of unknown function (DUF6521)
LIAHFLSGCENNSINTEMSYFVLPFLYKKESRELLNKANIKSTLYSIFLNDTNKKSRESLAGLEKRIEYFRTLTERSIIVASQKFDVKVSENLVIGNQLDYEKEEDVYIRQFYRSSHYLGKILSRQNTLETYFKLGMKDLWTATLKK